LVVLAPVEVDNTAAVVGTEVGYTAAALVDNTVVAVAARGLLVVA